jgi:hypothetical protein
VAGFILILFGGIYVFLEQLGVDAADRAGALVLLAIMVLVAAVWQAVGLGIARVRMVLRGIDLERPLGGTPSATDGRE